MKKWAALSIAISLLQGCGVISPARRSESKLSYLSIGDKKSDVINRIGTPDVMRGARFLDDGKSLEVAEYRLYDSSQWYENLLLGPLFLTMSWWIPKGHTQFYWIQYVDGKLDRWGHAGDWQPNVTADVTVRQR